MKSVAIILTDHKSISEKIIIKSINYLKKSKLKKIYFIGSLNFYKNLYKKIPKSNKFEFFNIKFNNRKPLNYLNKTTEFAIKLLKDKKIHFLINMPLNKKKFFNNKFNGFTEFFSHKLKLKNKENMLLYNKKFSVCPITTHIKIKDVSKKISKNKIKQAIKNIYIFYKKAFNKKPKIIVLGMNPHASKDFAYNNEDDLIIYPAIKELNQKKLRILGPVSSDTAFQKIKDDTVFIGMYHDQVLIPFKSINKFEGINITIGLKYLRLSPDHGVGNTKTNYNLINNLSFLKCINFCEQIKNV